MTSNPTRLLLALFAAFLLWTTAASGAAPEPVVKGNVIVDSATSKQFVPRGVNFPGYEYACQQGWSYGEDGTEPAEIGATAAAIATWRINTVRLPLNQDCWLGDHGLPSAGLTVDGYRNSVNNFVDALNAAGIAVILDLHWSNPDGLVAEGLRPMPDSRAPAFWQSVATRFKANRSVIFDLFNEPHSRWNSDDTKVFGLSWSCWANGGCQAPAEPDTVDTSGNSWYQATGLSALTSVVRATGATQPILLSGIDYANDLRGWIANAPQDNQLIAGFHNYTVQRCRTITCWNSEIAPVATKVPVLAAEFGQNDCGSPDHMKRFMDWADDHSIGYLAWAWWDLPDLGCSNFALVSDLNGTPLAPTGTALYNHLADLARGPTTPDPDPVDPPDPDNSFRPGTGPKEVVTVKRQPARLKFRLARLKGRALSLRVAINPLASFNVHVRVQLVQLRARRGQVKAKRTIRRQIRVPSGFGRLSVNVPAGFRPRLVVASYPGDQRLRPQTVQARPASVSSLTRSRRDN